MFLETWFPLLFTAFLEGVAGFVFTTWRPLSCGISLRGGQCGTESYRKLSFTAQASNRGEAETLQT